MSALIQQALAAMRERGDDAIYHASKWFYAEDMHPANDLVSESRKQEIAGIVLRHYENERTKS